MCEKYLHLRRNNTRDQGLMGTSQKYLHLRRNTNRDQGLMGTSQPLDAFSLAPMVFVYIGAGTEKEKDLILKKKKNRTLVFLENWSSNNAGPAFPQSTFGWG